MWSHYVTGMLEPPWYTACPSSPFALYVHEIKFSCGPPRTSWTIRLRRLPPGNHLPIAFEVFLNLFSLQVCNLNFWRENFFMHAEQKFCWYWIRLRLNARSGKVGSSHCYLDRWPLHEIATFNEIVYEYDKHSQQLIALSRVIFNTLFNIIRVCRSRYVL